MKCILKPSAIPIAAAYHMLAAVVTLLTFFLLSECAMAYMDLNTPRGQQIITSAKNTSSRMEFDLPSFTELIIDSILVKGEVPGFGRGKVLAVNSTGGVEPHTFDIKGNFDPEDLPAGEYELILTDANGCKVSKKFIITLNTSTICLSESHVQVYPNPTKEDLWINFDG